MVLGDANIQPNAAQLDEMESLVRDAMRDGAVGVSTSLEYAPAPYAKMEEIIALASEASKLGGIYATHMRSEGDAIMASLDETAHRQRSPHPRRNLAPQSGWKEELAPHARGPRKDRGGTS
jgi:dihydroorotase/N-acyl-D-amino-acid deacylase